MSGKPVSRSPSWSYTVCFRALRACKLYLIGVRNLIVEVNAQYIKGMLGNPNIEPSASINRWIIAILMFHFTLVHVPGTLHGPDGLSRRPPQPDNLPEPDDNFDDWVNQVYGFVHIINPAHRTAPPLSTIDTLAQAIAAPMGWRATYNSAVFPISSNAPTWPVAYPKTVPYDVIPRTPKSKAADQRILEVFEWHNTLRKPASVPDQAYETFMQYCTEFFISAGQLWRKDAQGAHKLVVPQDRQMDILHSCHNNVSHKGVFATRSIIAVRFWWPQMASDVIWFVRSCHLCQVCQVRNVLIPPMVATPAPLFSKIYMDTMFPPGFGRIPSHRTGKMLY